MAGKQHLKGDSVAVTPGTLLAQAADTEMTNGVCHEAPAVAVGPRQMINRTEYVRLLEQALHSLGYLAAAQLLERESARACRP